MSWLFKTECNHPSFTGIKDGVQYCTVCNKAFHPFKKMVKESHKLKNIEKNNIIVANREGLWGQIKQNQTMQQCEKCGKLFVFNDTTGKYVNEPEIDGCLQ